MGENEPFNFKGGCMANTKWGKRADAATELEKEYDYVEKLTPTLFKVTKGKLCGIHSIESDMLSLPVEYDDIIHVTESDPRLQFYLILKEGKYGLFSVEFELITLKVSCETIRYMGAGCFKVMINGQLCLANERTGEMKPIDITPPSLID